METKPQEQQYDLFLKRIGMVLIASAFLGYLALGITPDGSLLSKWLYFDANQNLLHVVIGVIALVAARKGSLVICRYASAIIGVLAIVAAAYSIYRYDFPSPNALIINIETPLETVFYLALGLWSLWVVLMPAGPVFVKDQNQLS